MGAIPTGGAMDVLKKVNRFLAQDPGDYHDLQDRIASIVYTYEECDPEDREALGLEPKKDWEDLDPGERDTYKYIAHKIIERLMYDGLLKFDKGRRK